MQPIPATFNTIDFIFDPVTTLGNMVSSSGVGVLYNIPTRRISKIISSNNQGIPYRIQLSPEDERFILDSIHSYEVYWGKTHPSYQAKAWYEIRILCNHR